MVEVTVHDVLFRVPKGAAVQWPQDASKLGSMATVVLKEREGEHYLSIWVGLPEAIAAGVLNGIGAGKHLLG